MVTQNYSIRLEPELVERLDRLAEAMSETVGVKVSRTQALRAAVEAGLGQAEVKFGITATKRKKK